MAYVSSGPVRTLPGASLRLPENTPCDAHPERMAVARIQGETDSMGCEASDVCQECLDEIRSQPNTLEGHCNYCKEHATDLSPTRDPDEGASGPVYYVCGKCQRKQAEALQKEYDSQHNDCRWDDEDDDCWRDDLVVLDDEDD